MSECAGAIGKLLGHNFVGILTKSVPPNNMKQIDGGPYVASILEAASIRQYTVICTRCGEEKEKP